MRISNILLAAALLICSCSTVRKTSSNSTVQSQHIDSSTNRKDYTKETSTTETATQTVYTRADSASIRYYISLLDTVAKWQSVSAGALQLEVSTTPQLTEGKVTGLTVYTRAKKDSEAVAAPVSRSTNTKETASEAHQTDVVDTHRETETSWSKQTKRLPAWLPFAIAAAVACFFIIVSFKFFRR